MPSLRTPSSWPDRLAELQASTPDLKEAPLRRDVRSLGTLLGNVLRRRGRASPSTPPWRLHAPYRHLLAAKPTVSTAAGNGSFQRRGSPSPAGHRLRRCLRPRHLLSPRLAPLASTSSPSTSPRPITANAAASPPSLDQRRPRPGEGPARQSPRHPSPPQTGQASPPNKALRPPQ